METPAGLGPDRQLSAQRFDAVAQPVEFGIGGGPGRRGPHSDLDDLEAEHMLIFSHRDRHRSPADMLECLETAEVNPLPRLRRAAPAERRRRHGCPRPPRRTAVPREATRVEQRR